MILVEWNDSLFDRKLFHLFRDWRDTFLRCLKFLFFFSKEMKYRNFEHHNK